MAVSQGLYRGQLDHAERRHVRVIGKALRFGMTLFLLGSIGSVVSAYVDGVETQPGLSALYWISNALALVVIFASLAHARSPKPSALVFAVIAIGWMFLFLGAAGWLSGLSFGAAVAAYVVCTGAGYGLIEYGRFLASPRHHSHPV